MAFRKGLHPVAKWLRGVGIAALLLGLGTLMLASPQAFWFAIIFIYGGLLLLLIDVWLEPELKNHFRWRIVITASLIILASIVTKAFVWIDADLGITAVVVDANRQKGTKIAGIDFRPEFTELQVAIQNSSSRSYEDLDLLLTPSEPIAFIAQLTDVPSVSIQEKRSLEIRPLEVKTGIALNVELLATDAGYVLRCPHLASKAIIKLEIALVHIKDVPPPNAKKDDFGNKNVVFTIKMSDRSTYWFGHRDGDVYLPSRPKPSLLDVEGHYDVTLRRKSLTMRLPLTAAAAQAAGAK
jgi:hypothetical protein